jgi:hypothetical protein
MDRQHLSLGIEFLDFRSEGVAGITEEAAETGGFLERLGNLSTIDKVFELGTSLTAKTFLQPSSTCLQRGGTTKLGYIFAEWQHEFRISRSYLPNIHFRGVCNVALQGITAAVHLVRLHRWG